MKRPFTSVSLLISVMAVASCAELNVAVDIASPHVVERRLADELIRDSLPEARRQSRHPDEVDALINAVIELLQRQYVERGTSMAQRDLPDGNTSVSEQQALRARLQTEFTKEVAPRYRVLAASWRSTNTEIETTYQNWSRCDRCWTRWRNNVSGAGLKNVDPPSAAKEANKTAAAAAGDKECESLQPRVDCGDLQNTKAYLVALLKRREGYIQQVQSALRTEAVAPETIRQLDALKSLIGEDGLFRSVEAHAIAAAQPGDWVRRFDESHARAFMGDVNVALKMETRGSFTVKGLSFDPSEIARVASRVMTQTLIAATQPASLVTMPKSRRLATEETGVDDVLAFEERKKVRRKALLALAARVVAEERAFENQDTAQDAAKAIVRTWDAQRQLIVLDSVTATPPEVVALLPDKMTIAPGETRRLLIALAAAAEKKTELLLTSTTASVGVASQEGKNVAVLNEKARTTEIEVTGAAIGASKISAGTADGKSASATVCVVPLIEISGANRIVGPAETVYSLKLKKFGDAGDIIDESPLNVAIHSQGSGVRLAPAEVKTEQGQGEFSVTPFNAGTVILTATLPAPACETARTDTHEITIDPLELKWTAKYEELTVGDDKDWELTVEADPPEDLELTVVSSAPEILEVTDAKRSIATAGKVTFTVKALKAGQATLSVKSDRSIFKVPADVPVVVKVEETATGSE